MGSYFLNIKTNKVHYVSEEKKGCYARIHNNPENYKEYSSLEEIKHTGKKVSICNTCMYGEARKEWVETFGKYDGDREINYYSGERTQKRGLDSGSAYLIFCIVAFIAFVVMFLFMFRSCGNSSYEHICDFPGCDEHAEYSTGGHKYCPEHYRIVTY
jgi:hypothetical protein